MSKLKLVVSSMQNDWVGTVSAHDALREAGWKPDPDDPLRLHASSGASFTGDDYGFRLVAQNGATSRFDHNMPVVVMVAACLAAAAAPPCGRCKGTGVDPEHVSTEVYGDGLIRELPQPCNACQLEGSGA